MAGGETELTPASFGVLPSGTPRCLRAGTENMALSSTSAVIAVGRQDLDLVVCFWVEARFSGDVRCACTVYPFPKCFRSSFLAPLPPLSFPPSSRLLPSQFRAPLEGFLEGLSGAESGGIP